MLPVHIGFIGLGNHTFDYHFRVVKSLPDYFSIESVYDPDGKRMDLIKGDENILSLKSIEELLSSKTIEAVAIATPHELHLDLIKKSLMSGKHVFCEKPLCTRKKDVNHLIDLIDLAKDKQLILTSCHPRRFDPCFTKLKNSLIILQQTFGNIIEFNFRFHNRPAPVQWKAESNLMLDQVGHEIDLVSFILGPCKTKLWKSYDNPLSYIVQGRRTDGINLFFSEHRCFTGNHRYFELEIVMPHGRTSIKQSMDVVSNVELVRKTTENFVSSTITEDYMHQREYSSVFSRLMQHFYRSIRKEESPYLDKADMLRNTIVGINLTDSHDLKVVEIE